ncbi:MAG TPA: right-handed parallel beta-helix repeat-containing protein [Candidatus Bathyarchaeia archaeon]|nr:right-handed parallel beta-helix repeat-containing protein [Candidatus Bathyarchaeia archaeon]
MVHHTAKTPIIFCILSMVSCFSSSLFCQHAKKFQRIHEMLAKTPYEKLSRQTCGSCGYVPDKTTRGSSIVQLAAFPVTITQPGEYALVDSTTIIKPLSYAIKIASDNVTLHLATHTLDGQGMVDQLIIVENCSNININSGTLTGAQSAGLVLSGASTVFCSQVDIFNTQNADGAGLIIDNSSSIIMARVKSINPCSTQYQITNSSTINIALGEASAPLVTDTGTGVSISSSDHVYVEEFKANNQQYGIAIDNSEFITIRMVDASNNSIAGFVTDPLSYSVALIGCQAISGFYDGFIIQTPGAIIIACKALYNQWDGFYLDADNILLERAGATLNENNGCTISSNASHVSILDSTFIQSENVDIEDNGADTTIYTLEQVQKMSVAAYEAIGTEDDALLDMSSYIPTNLTASVPDYTSTTALNTIDASLVSWCKTLMDRILGLEFKLNQILNMQ